MTLDAIIRVDHAGEFGAKRIYEGQLKFLQNEDTRKLVQEMYTQELQHLEEFEKLAIEHKVRPTALMPLWNIAGFALGAATAILGDKAAMACTAAIEEVIDEHYQKQIENLSGNDSIKTTLEKFRQEEVEHKNTALLHGAEQAPAYPLLSAAIKASSRMAIWLSERV